VISPGRTISNSFDQLLFALMPSGGQQGGHGMMTAAMVKKCVWWLILLVLCAWFYVDASIIVAENWLMNY
jgi:hypothetical protein